MKHTFQGNNSSSHSSNGSDEETRRDQDSGTEDLDSRSNRLPITRVPAIPNPMFLFPDFMTFDPARDFAHDILSGSGTEDEDPLQRTIDILDVAISIVQDVPPSAMTDEEEDDRNHSCTHNNNKCHHHHSHHNHNRPAPQ